MDNLNINEEISKPFLPEDENGYSKTIKIDLAERGFRDIDIRVPAKPKEKYEIEMWDVINEFETQSWDASRKGLDTGFPKINKAFDGGLKAGFTVIAAESNIGKTAFISQLANQIVNNNQDVYVMDFSLDDPMPDKLSRIVACDSKIPINAVKSPLNYTEYPLMLTRRIVGLNRLRGITDKYRAYDATFTTDIEKIEEEVIRIKVELDSQGSNKQIVVFIDNFHDLTSRDHPNYLDKQKYDYLAQACSDLAIRYDIPVVCSAELRKTNSNGRPTLDDVREAVKIKYEAKAILLCHNDTHSKGEAANVFFNRKDKPGQKQPIFEVHFAKNKFSDYKGRLFYESYPEMARMEEVDDQTSKLYQATITGK
jgi:replicative DNA helicase